MIDLSFLALFVVLTWCMRCELLLKSNCSLSHLRKEKEKRKKLKKYVDDSLKRGNNFLKNI